MITADQTVHKLQGLQAEPLASYLSALGVIRLVTEQRDPEATCCWQDQTFVLQTKLDREDLLSFFLEQYSPTPLTSPWNGGSGYYDNDNKDAITAIESSEHPRFGEYRETISTVRRVLSKLQLQAKPEGSLKPELLKALRSHLSDQALKWLDATTALGATDTNGETSVRYAPLLGTGGNDGRLEFSNNFMQRLTEFFLNPKAKPKQTAELLRSALFGEVGRYLSSNPVGQFDPGSAGGVNLGVGFEAKAALNPWYYILMIEGAMVLSTAAVGRFRSGMRGASFPFTVSHLGSGHGKLASGEGNRNEIWLPLWSRPTRYREVHKLFAEGRAQNGSRQARNPIEFSIALASHGTSRGLSGFTRFAFLQRNGKSYFATPLGYYPVGLKEGAGLIRRLEQYFSPSRGIFIEHSQAAQSMMRRYDSAVLNFMKSGRARDLTTVLERLGALHRYTAQNEKLCEKVRAFPSLSREWAKLACDHSPEFFLAYSLSTLGAGRTEVEYNLRAQLSPYNPGTRAWKTEGFIARWKGRDLCEKLQRLLTHRLRQADRVGFEEKEGSNKPYNSPLRGSAGAALSHLEMLISKQVNEDRIENLLFALVLLEPHRRVVQPSDSPWFLGLPYIVCKLALHQGHPIRPDQETDNFTDQYFERDTRAPSPSIVRYLATGNIKGALQLARRFLLTRPLVLPSHTLQCVDISPDHSRRLAAALAFPITDQTYRQLYDRVFLPITEQQQESENRNHD